MKTITRSPDEGEKLWFHGGGVHTWRVTSADTDGQVAVVEDTLERGKLTPLHKHPDNDEVVYVLEGELMVYDPAGPRTVGAGGVIVNPRGTPHALVVTSARARTLSIVTPSAKVEQFYRRASTPGESGPLDFAKVGAAAQATGATVILGPPPFKPPQP
jgi:quercetin dioxygenase-like cupin family protein